MSQSKLVNTLNDLLIILKVKETMMWAFGIRHFKIRLTSCNCWTSFWKVSQFYWNLWWGLSWSLGLHILTLVEFCFKSCFSIEDATPSSSKPLFKYWPTSKEVSDLANEKSQVAIPQFGLFFSQIYVTASGKQLLPEIETLDVSAFEIELWFRW